MSVLQLNYLITTDLSPYTYLCLGCGDTTWYYDNPDTYKDRIFKKKYCDLVYTVALLCTMSMSDTIRLIGPEHSPVDS